jgi:hypothetical protein
MAVNGKLPLLPRKRSMDLAPGWGHRVCSDLGFPLLSCGIIS